jgi:hypothetical protein
VPLKDLTDRNAVIEAMDEYDRLGAEDFHAKYGFGPSLKFPLVYEGKKYPSKAIAAVAYSFQFPDRPLLTEESTHYSGGTATVVPKLRELGFDVDDLGRDVSPAISNPDDPNSFQEILEEILRLQPEWQSLNTSAMQRRGHLIRDAAPSILKGFLPESGPPPRDLSAGGRDGAGRRTRIPLIRVFSEARSPKATMGWYLVYLFAGDGGSVSLSLNQGSATMEGEQIKPKPDPYLRERVDWALGVLGDRVKGDPRYLSAIDLHDAHDLGRAYEKSHVVGIEYKAEAIPSDTELRQDLMELLPLLMALYEAESPSPAPPAEVNSSETAVHLVVKWSPSHARDTIERHAEIASSRGAVWWGVFTSSDSQKVGASTLATLRGQLRDRITTHAWLSGPADLPVQQTELLDISETRPVEDDLIPSYYPDNVRHKVWLKLRGFDEVDRDWLLRNLESAAQPGKLVALGIQTNPLIIKERDRPRVWWVNQGSSYRRARDGGYIWAPVKDKTGRALPHWDAMKYPPSRRCDPPLRQH